MGGSRCGEKRVGRSPPSMCGARGTLEYRGEARMRGCKSGREGEWEGICGRGEGCGRRLLATVYGARDARAHIARAVAADAPSPGAAPHTLLRDGSRARAHIARAAAADAPGPGAAPCTPQRDGSGAAPSASLEPRSASSEPRPAFCPPSSESMAPRRGKDEHGVVAAGAEVGECEHHCKCQVRVKCHVSVK